jgi:hypothetical protein
MKSWKQKTPKAFVKIPQKNALKIFFLKFSVQMASVLHELIVIATLRTILR